MILKNSNVLSVLLKNKIRICLLVCVIVARAHKNKCMSYEMFMCKHMYN